MRNWSVSIDLTKKTKIFNYIIAPERCYENEFRCNDGECIDIIRRCDRNRDCYDGSDELSCPNGKDLLT